MMAKTNFLLEEMENPDYNANTRIKDNKGVKEANSDKINRLLEAKEKILQVNEKLDLRIKELILERKKWRNYLKL